MAQPYVGEIRMFGGSFAPVGWMFCDGQLLPISEHEVLFTLIGTTYGGDGQSTFGLPDLRGRIPVHNGHGPGLSQNYLIGEATGVESVNLTAQQVPSHTHQMVASTGPGSSKNPENNVVGSPPAVTMFFRASPNVNLASTMVSSVGGSQPHENMMPFLTVSYIISLFGLFPSQS
jgi:microcystin-dependent protein